MTSIDKGVTCGETWFELLKSLAGRSVLLLSGLNCSKIEKGIYLFASARFRPFRWIRLPKPAWEDLAWNLL